MHEVRDGKSVAACSRFMPLQQQLFRLSQRVQAEKKKEKFQCQTEGWRGKT
jgi:hypothetical protein